MAGHEPVLTGLMRYVEYGDRDLHARSRPMVFAVALHFNEGVLVIEVDPDDDTVALRLGSGVDLRHWPDATATDRTSELPWSSLLGSDCPWRWLLTNQQGYQDGVQVELSRNGQDLWVQWIAMASSLRLARVDLDQ